MIVTYKNNEYIVFHVARNRVILFAANGYLIVPIEKVKFK